MGCVGIFILPIALVVGWLAWLIGMIKIPGTAVMGGRGKSRGHDRLGACGDPKGRQCADRLSGWSGVTYAATAGQHTALPVCFLPIPRWVGKNKKSVGKGVGLCAGRGFRGGFVRWG